MSTKQNFQKNIRRLLEKHDLSRQAFGKKLNVPISTINEWCRGQNCPRADMLDKIADFFSTTVSELVSDTTAQKNLIDISSEFQQYTDLNVDNRKKVIEFMQFLRMREIAHS